MSCSSCCLCGVSLSAPPLAFLNDELISLTLFEDDAKEKGKMALYGIFKVIQYVATLIISGLLVYQIWTIVNTQLSTGEATTVLKYPPVDHELRHPGGHGAHRGVWCH